MSSTGPVKPGDRVLTEYGFGTIVARWIDSRPLMEREWFWTVALDAGYRKVIAADLCKALEQEGAP